MELMTGTIRLPASKEVVWEALNDPEVLKRCIPGCQSLTRMSDLAFEAAVVLKIGPMNANFTGSFTLENLDPPHGCTIVGTAQGGPAGFVEGRALVQITSIEEKVSSLNYTVEAQIGGKLIQIGSRLVHSSAKKLADEFFQRLEHTLSESNTSESSPILQKLPGLARPGYPAYLDRQFLLVIAGGILLSWIHFSLLSHGSWVDSPPSTLEQQLVDLEARIIRLENSGLSEMESQEAIGSETSGSISSGLEASGP